MRQDGRIDLHTHSLFSDGALLPSELLRRAEHLEYAAVAITDHVDASNLDEVVAQLVRFSSQGTRGFGLAFLPGVEITHVPPQHISALARRAKLLGARLVLVHGETAAEPVAPGTNRAAVECPDVDILAHPGFLTTDEARHAARTGILLELTSRAGHNITNGHVAREALRAGARLLVNTDSHIPSDMMDQSRARMIALGAGLSEDETYTALVTTPAQLVARLAAPAVRYDAEGGGP